MNKQKQDTRNNPAASDARPQDRLPERRRHRVLQGMKAYVPRGVKALIEYGPDLYELAEQIITAFFG